MLHNIRFWCASFQYLFLRENWVKFVEAIHQFIKELKEMTGKYQVCLSMSEWIKCCLLLSITFSRHRLRPSVPSDNFLLLLSLSLSLFDYQINFHNISPLSLKRFLSSNVDIFLFSHQFWFDLGYEKGKQALYSISFFPFFQVPFHPLCCYFSRQFSLTWLEMTWSIFLR